MRSTAAQLLIHMKIQIIECSSHDLPQCEATFQNRGFRLVNVTREKDLKVMEYLKRSFHGSAHSMGRDERWTLILREE